MPRVLAYSLSLAMKPPQTAEFCMCHVHSDRSFDAQAEGWELSFTGGKMRTAAQETPQLALRKIRYQFKEFSILCRERCKPLGSLNSVLYLHLSYLRSKLFSQLAFPQLPSNHSGGVAASAGSQFWELSFTSGGQKSLMAVTFLINMAGDIFISHRFSYDLLLIVPSQEQQ